MNWCDLDKKNKNNITACASLYRLFVWIQHLCLPEKSCSLCACYSQEACDVVWSFSGTESAACDGSDVFVPSVLVMWLSRSLFIELTSWRTSGWWKRPKDSPARSERVEKWVNATIDVLETYRLWSQRTPAVFLVFPPAPHTRAPAGSSPAGQTVSPAGPLRCSEFHIPAQVQSIPLIKHMARKQQMPCLQRRTSHSV